LSVEIFGGLSVCPSITVAVARLVAGPLKGAELIAQFAFRADASNRRRRSVEYRLEAAASQAWRRLDQLPADVLEAIRRGIGTAAWNEKMANKSGDRRRQLASYRGTACSPLTWDMSSVAPELISRFP